MLKKCFPVLLVVVVSACAHTPRHLVPPHPTNQDGRISRAEFEDHLSALAGVLDKNGDRVLQVEESASEAAPHWVREADKNGDGRITVIEYMRAADAQFEMADVDKKNRLKKSQFELIALPQH